MALVFDGSVMMVEIHITVERRTGNPRRFSNIAFTSSNCSVDSSCKSQLTSCSNSTVNCDL